MRQIAANRFQVPFRVRSAVRCRILSHASGPAGNRIQEIVDYLLANNGPDQNGRAHPTFKRLQASDLREALRKAKNQGLHRDWQVYHFPGTLNMWDDPKTRDDVIIKKVEQLANGKKYQGDILSMFLDIHAKDLFSTLLMAAVAGRTVPVSMAVIAEDSEIRCSPFRMAQKYLALKIPLETDPARKTFLEAIRRDLKPEHMDRAAANTWDQTTKTRVMLAKIEQVTMSEKYQGDFLEMVLQANGHELLETPFKDTVAGRFVDVTMGNIKRDPQINGSPYRLLQRVIAERIRLETDPKQKKLFRAIRRDLKPEHMVRSPHNTWDWETKNRVIFRKGNQLLHDAKYQGDFLGMIFGIDVQEVFRTPYEDRVAGRSVSVSLGSVGRDTDISDSPYRFVRRYLALIFRREQDRARQQFIGEILRDLKPEHMVKAANGTWDDDTKKRVIINKVRQLMATRNLRTIIELIKIPNLYEIFLTPLESTVAGRKVLVPIGMIESRRIGTPYNLRTALRYFVTAELEGNERTEALEAIDGRYPLSNS